MHVKSYTTTTTAAIFIWTLQTETKNADICCTRKVTRKLEVELEGIHANLVLSQIPGLLHFFLMKTLPPLHPSVLLFPLDFLAP